jgi:hypothetical protein
MQLNDKIKYIKWQTGSSLTFSKPKNMLLICLYPLLSFSKITPVCVTQEVEHFPSKHKALTSKPSSTKKVLVKSNFNTWNIP